jgi:hypothetical protein
MYHLQDLKFKSDIPSRALGGSAGATCRATRYDSIARILRKPYAPWVWGKGWQFKRCYKSRRGQCTSAKLRDDQDLGTQSLKLSRIDKRASTEVGQDWGQDNVDDSIVQHEVHDAQTFEPLVLRNGKSVRSRAHNGQRL